MQTRNKPTILSCFSLILFLLCACQSEKPVENTEIVKQEDRQAPILENLDPANQNQVSSTIIESIVVKGTLRDESEITVLTIADQNVPLTPGSEKGTYVFEMKLSLSPGENTFELQAKDSYGNTLTKSISYVNGQPMNLILQSERQELPPEGKTYFEVFLDDGQRTPLKIEEVELTAQQGYFKGPEYRAPSHSGTDIIMARYKPRNAVGKTQITVRAPRLKGAWKGENKLAIGDTAQFSMTVENIGDTEAVKSELVIKIPDNVVLKSKDARARYLPAVGEIRWDLGSFGPGVKEEVVFSVYGKKAGDGVFEVNIESAREKLISERHRIQVIGEIELNHTCNRSVAQIEKNLKMTITVRPNQNVSELKLTYEFPDECNFVNAVAKAPTEQKIGFVVSGRKVLFTPINTLLKDQTAEFEVEVLVKRYGELTHTAQVEYKGNSGPQEVANRLNIPSAN